VDWIGVNVYPWWENKYSPLFPCIPAEEAAAFHRSRVENVQAVGFQIKNEILRSPSVKWPDRV
jgi:hypothetical protein